MSLLHCGKSNEPANNACSMRRRLGTPSLMQAGFCCLNTHVRKDLRRKGQETKMLTYTGGTTVTKGTYWNLGNGERAVLTGQGLLPGNARSTYLKAPAIVMVLMGPILGFFYVLVLPFIGMAMILTVIARQLAHMLADFVGMTAAFGWRPVEAYLMSHKRKAKRDKQPDPDQTKTVS
jgi:hypothetical protein